MPLVRVVLSSRSSRGSGFWCPVAVSLDGDRSWPEHLNPSVADLPTGEIGANQGVHVQPEVPLPQPDDDPPEGEVVDVAEGAFAHPVTEVVDTVPAAPGSTGAAGLRAFDVSPDESAPAPCP